MTNIRYDYHQHQHQDVKLGWEMYLYLIRLLSALCQSCPVFKCIFLTINVECIFDDGARLNFWPHIAFTLGQNARWIDHLFCWADNWHKSEADFLKCQFDLGFVILITSFFLSHRIHSRFIKVEYIANWNFKYGKFQGNFWST